MLPRSLLRSLAPVSNFCFSNTKTQLSIALNWVFLYADTALSKRITIQIVQNAHILLEISLFFNQKGF